MTSATSDAADTAKDVKTAYKKVTDSLAALAKVSDDTKVSAAQTDFSKSLSDYQDAVKQAQDAESGLQKALTAWNAPAADDRTKDSKVAKAGDQSGATDTGASAAVANSVALIVQTIVWQNFTTEQCQKAMFENFATTAAPVKRFCLAHLVKADEIREKQLLGTLVVNNAKPQTPLPNYIAFDGGVAAGSAATPLQLYEWIDQGSIDQKKIDQIRSDQIFTDKAMIEQAKKDQADADKTLLHDALDKMNLLQQQMNQLQPQSPAIHTSGCR